MIDVRSRAPTLRRAAAGHVSHGLLGVLVALAAALTLAHSDGLAARLVAVAAQTGLLALFYRSALAATGSWAACAPVTAAAWFVLFLLPSLAFAADPTLIQISGDQSRLVLETLEMVNLGLGATCLGWWLARRALARRGDAEAITKLDVPALRVLPRRCAAMGALGLLAVAFLVEHGGGLSQYLSHLNNTAAANGGLTYVFGVAMCLKFAAGMPLLAAWSRGQRGPRRFLAAYALSVIGLGVLLGSRGTIVIGILEWLVLRALVWRTPAARRVLPWAVAGAVVIVFVLGAVKRYQSFEAQNPGTKVTLASYMTTRAPREVVSAYVDNYVDTVRLVGLARSVVPSRAGYEPGYQFLHLVLHPIPSAIRPKISRSQVITAAFQPGGSAYAYAVPLIASAYLGFGAAGIVVAAALLGAVVALLDRLARGRRSGTAAAAIACAMVGVTLVMRSGMPEGLAFAFIDVVAAAAVTAVATRPAS